MPALTTFYREHNAKRDRFEIISICIDSEGELKSIADLDRDIKPIVNAVWDGKPLPFPVLLDNTFRTLETFGVERVGQTVLVDPEGRLVEGDETTLAEKLRK